MIKILHCIKIDVIKWHNLQLSNGKQQRTSGCLMFSVWQQKVVQLENIYFCAVLEHDKKFKKEYLKCVLVYLFKKN